ncbi:CFI-box-CTERM domain-containing protein [Endozoicomonas ascidiicola]|uniref:CFI-box-CTERM domain-containing protein n=1 Tax=Endozoicomonas ascidiicola TaxID=1698521 RepID=UPI0008351F64|nr:CFI-box-CTERM domain-containing protein [Endozoicomonas ascidiicola]
MLAIENNPFRVIGVLANAKEKDIHRQKVKISKYVSVGKSVSSEYDFEFLSPLERTEKSVKDAFAKIDQRQDKLEHSLFWFVNCSQFDEIGLFHLGDSNQERAIITWAKVIDGREVTSKNISTLNNYSTLQLCSISENQFSSGIANKLKLIQAHVFPEFVAAVTDDSFIVDAHKLSQNFIKRIVQLQLNNSKPETEIVNSFSQCEQWVKDFVAQSFCEDLIFDIERAVTATEKQRKKEKENTYSLAVTLKNNVIYKLKKVSDLIGTHHIKFKTVSDAVAQEIVNCDVAYYNASQESGKLFDQSLELLGYAKMFAVSEKLKRDIQGNIDDMLKRKEQHLVSKYYDDIFEEIENFKKRYVSIENTQAFINICIPKLNAYLSKQGRTEDFIKLSSIVVTVALNALIEKVNGVQNGGYTSEIITNTFSRACTAMSSLSRLNMNAETRARFNTNNQTITDLHSKASVWHQQQQKKQEGCYIATMAYGDYEHPQVIKLREFRDQILAKNWLGRNFIKWYYKYSPLMVQTLENNHTVNKLVRSCLDGFIMLMGKK